MEIFGTLGPQCIDKDILKEMFRCGMTGMRLNLSHCNLWEREDWLNCYFEAANEMNINGDLIVDLKGPELRIQTLKEPIEVQLNEITVLNKKIFPNEILENIVIDDCLFIDDGKVKLKLIKKDDDHLYFNVVYAGIIQSYKSVAIENKNITGAILTVSDIDNLKVAKEYGVTGIMQPFVQSKADLLYVKGVLTQLGLEDIKIYAKIETRDGFEHLEEIIPCCDEIVIARGDLGNSVGLVQLPIIQHQIEEMCKRYHKDYMVVTQMLDSMRNSPVPTRAEVCDVFHAILHGANSVMLTGETAQGKYPLEAMHMFCDLVKEAQNYIRK